MAYPDPSLVEVTSGEQVRFATTDDFLDIAENVSGQELDWLFEIYLRQPALPRLNARREGDTLRISWATPGALSFPMPVEVWIGEELRRIDVPIDGYADVQVPEGGRAVLDPNAWILRANQQPLAF
jgi:hypothetical protein